MMSNFRKLASQLCAIFPYNCLHIAYGTYMGYVVIVIAQLTKKDAEITTTLDQLTSFAGLEIIKPICTIITGLLMHRWGCRPVAFMAALLYIASGLLYSYSTSVIMIFIGRLLSSLFSITSIANPYIGEVSEPELSSHLFMVAHLCNMTGGFFTQLLGSLMYWRTIAFANLIFPVLAAVTVMATPQSPVWLASKGRLNEAENSLCWVRGWVKPKPVQAELDTFIESVQKSNSISKKQTFDIEAITWQQRSKRFFKLFIQRSFYIPLGTMCLIFLLYSTNGVMTVVIYSTVIFRELDSPIKDSVATAIMEAMGLIGSLVILFLIRRVSRRNLIFFTVVNTGLCYAAVAVVGFLELKGQYLWIPTIAVIIARFFNMIGIEASVFMLASEIFPSSVRYIGSSISLSVKLVMESLMRKLFLYVVKAYTMPGVFAFFAFMNLIGLITYYFLFPEFDGRSLREMENRYTAVRCKQVREISNNNG